MHSHTHAYSYNWLITVVGWQMLTRESYFRRKSLVITYKDLDAFIKIMILTSVYKKQFALIHFLIHNFHHVRSFKDHSQCYLSTKPFTCLQHVYILPYSRFILCPSYVCRDTWFFNHLLGNCICTLLNILEEGVHV